MGNQQQQRDDAHRHRPAFALNGRTRLQQRLHRWADDRSTPSAFALTELKPIGHAGNLASAFLVIDRVVSPILASRSPFSEEIHIMLVWLDRSPLWLLLVLALTLGLAPFVPEPHLWEKLKLLAAGQLVRPIDIFDLLLHGVPWLLLLAKLGRLVVTRGRDAGALS
jgi:hypothetical protein